MIEKIQSCDWSFKATPFSNLMTKIFFGQDRQKIEKTVDDCIQFFFMKINIFSNYLFIIWYTYQKLTAFSMYVECRY